MPELPEVEIVRRSLEKKIKNQKIKKVIVRNRNLRFKVPKGFESFLKNQKIIKVNRYSKYLILSLSNNSYCLIHLGMSGTIHLVKKRQKNIFTNTSFYNSPKLPKKHNHIELIFEYFKIIYNDPRRFGFFEILENNNLLNNRFNHLGPEPFSKKFNIEYVNLFLKKKEKNIKNFLIDQNFVSGIGNIYASEILYLSKVNPTKKAKLLNKNEQKKIISNSRKVLYEAIKKGGSTIRDFKDALGLKGNFQSNFKVYQREGLSCKRKGCKGIVKKKFVLKRSTFFCNTCQI